MLSKFVVISKELQYRRAIYIYMYSIQGLFDCLVSVRRIQLRYMQRALPYRTAEMRLQGYNFLRDAIS